MRKDFYIFRHGETDYNQQRRWQGQGIDLDLNDNGKAQAEILASKLKDKGLEIIYSSPLKRAKQTAEAVARYYNIPIEIIPELTEGGLGDCEGILRDEVAQKYPDIWNIWYGDNQIMDVRWPNGESKLEIQQRMTKAFNSLLSRPESIIGIASHGAAIRYFLLQFGYGPHRIKNTALFHLVFDNGNWDLVGIDL